jgi:hypothetical protein
VRWVLAGLVLTACDGEPPPPPTRATVPVPTLSVTPSRSVGRDQGVVVLEAGRLPRSRLSYGFVEGAQTTWVVEAHAVATSAGQGSPIELSATVHARVVRVRGDAAELSLRLEASPPFERVEATLSMHRSGRALRPLMPQRALTKPEEQLFATFAEAVADAWIELPGSPIGLGAKWRIVRPRSRGGVALWRTARAELTEGGDAIRIVATVSEQPTKAWTSLGDGLRVRGLDGAGVGHHRLAWPAGAPFATAVQSDVAVNLQVQAEATTATGTARPVTQRVETTQVVTLVSQAALDVTADAGQNLRDDR